MIEYTSKTDTHGKHTCMYVQKIWSKTVDGFKYVAINK